MPTTARTRTDACPGVVSPHLAADGALARVRLPGGMISASALRAVAALARDAGDGSVHLTSRGNLQLRGLDPADPRPVQRLTEAGLLPSVTHERVRNVLASPLSGIAGGCADVRGLAAALDRGLCARPGLAALPGRFLIAIDDGRGDVAGERPDLCWRASTPDDGDLLVAGTRTGLRCGPAEAPELLLDAAEVFLDLRAEHTDDPEARAWRATELPDAPSRIARALLREAPARGTHSRPPEGGTVHLDAESRTRAHLDSTSPPHPPRRESRHGSPGSNHVTLDDTSVVGEVGGGSVGVGVVLGELSASHIELLSDVAPEVLVTPWRTLVLPTPVAGAIDRLRAAGLIVDPGHPALRVSACAGEPGCAKSLADVRGDARELIRLDPTGPVHVAGCARRCGAPHTPHTDAVATGPLTYEIDGTSPPGPLRRAAAPPNTTAPPSAIAPGDAAHAAPGVPAAPGHAAPADTTAPPDRTPAGPTEEPPLSGHDYITDGAEIYRRSFATIRAEADLSGMPPGMADVAVRMIHACGQVDLPTDIGASEHLVDSVRRALKAGAPILCDAMMVASGVTAARLPAYNEVLCLLRDPRVPELATEIGNTRSAAAFELLTDRFEGAVITIGNAPTALFHVLDLIDRGAPRPAAILGIPVGFVGAVESKQALAARTDLEYLVVHGRRGGSAITAAALNALAHEQEIIA